MKNCIKFLFLFLIFSSCQKDLTCSDFKEGTFSMRADNKSYMIVRKGNIQIEYIKGAKNNIDNKPLPITLQWVDECSYRLKFNDRKMKIKDFQKKINDNNGILVEITSINGSCMEYKSSFTSKEGKTTEQKGTICKEL